jgi:quinohemoprotein amine dehydrogenase
MARWLWLMAVPIALGGVGGGAHAQDAAAILNGKCAACHERTSDGLARIKDQRKTPEAWDMTIVRMMQLHGVEVTDAERATLVKYLADTQGLAPAETEGFRYILEREPAAIEEPATDELGTMCARCHSYARVALQRRTEDEWRKLAHFHLGQYPTAEYQALGRDRNWWEIASEKLPAELAERYPLDTPEWQAWRDRPHPDLAGRYRLIGNQPGRGGFEGTSEVIADGDDAYSYEFEITYEDGATETGGGNGILYTGYEWRGSTAIGDTAIREVSQVAEDGSGAEGRFFLAESDSLGGRLSATRIDGDSRVLAVWPPHLRAGESAELAIHGTGLEGDVGLGSGVTVDEVVSSDAETVVVRVSAATDAAGGPRAVSVGETTADGLLTVYQAIDFVTVEPSYNIARVGGGGGPIPPVPAQFEAVAWLQGPDGEAGTDDDIAIGAMPATWAVQNFDEAAKEMDDAAFAGEMQANGLFMPAEAGLNPERPFDTNNAGNLTVIATVKDADQTLSGEGQLLVTVQRWNDPPIR